MKGRFLTGVIVCVVLCSLAGVLSAQEELTVPIQVSPGTLNLSSNGVWVTVHADIPYVVVAGSSVTLNGVPATFTKADDCGYLVAKFAIQTIKDVVSPGNDVAMTLAGNRKDGVFFSGTDYIRVIKRGK